MPGFYSDSSEKTRFNKAKRVQAKLKAKGLDPRSCGYMRAFHYHMSRP
jgi:hypothetical protein